MTIAVFEFDLIGVKPIPEGPYGTIGQPPLPSMKPGTVVAGDSEAEFTFLLFPVYSAGFVLNQGDFVTWDQSYYAKVLNLTTATALPVGADVGAVCFGGRSGDPAAYPNAGNAWSYTFPAVGVYGIWVQRAGTSLGNWGGTLTSQATQATSSGTAGQLTANSSPPTHSQSVLGAMIVAAGGTFVANTVSGSNQLSGLTGFATGAGLEIGENLSGTGIPNGAYVTDIQGTVVYMNVNATATNTGTTITATKHTQWITTLNGSPLVTTPSINGLYPNQLLTAVGLAGGAATILSISGNSGNYTLTMSGNSTASATVTALGSKYVETFLRWPYLSSAAA